MLLLRRLWSEPLLDVDTEFHRIDRASINPRLDRPVPIWFGGFSDVQQDRCARIGDGMLWTGNTSLARKGNETIRAHAAELGRNPESIGFQAGVRPKDGEPMQTPCSGGRRPAAPTPPSASLPRACAAVTSSMPSHACVKRSATSSARRAGRAARLTEPPPRSTCLHACRRSRPTACLINRIRGYRTLRRPRSKVS